MNPSNRRAKLILMVEANAPDAYMLKSALIDAACKCEVITVDGGEAALAYLFNDSNRIPSIIVAGMRLIRMDGLQLLRKLKGDRRTCDIPVVMLSGSQSPQHMEGALAVGARDYLLKPYSLKGYTDLGKHLKAICDALPA